MKFSTCTIAVLLVFTLLALSSCGEPDEPVDPFHFEKPAFLWIEEQFDAPGTLYVRALVFYKSADTIQSAGFVFTDGIVGLNDPTGGRRDPDLETDNVVAVKKHTPSPSAGTGQYRLDTLINPTRVGDLTGSKTAVVNVAAYVRSTSGKTYLSDTETYYGAKLAAGSIYPAYAKAGATVELVLNRYLENNAVTTSLTSKSYPLSLSILGKDVPFTMHATDKRKVTFTMPSGVDTETPLVLKAGDYVSSSETKLKNVSRGFQLLTSKERNSTGAPCLVATPDYIFLGAGRKPDDNKLAVDFWIYDLETKTWGQRTDIPAAATPSGMSFYLNDKVWFGSPTNMMQYDIPSGAWESLPDPTSNIQYDHTFSDAHYVIYHNFLYFTNFSPEFTATIHYYNSYQFNPMTMGYSHLNAYPGDKSTPSEYLSSGLATNNVLHFFPNFEHWTYNLNAGTWVKKSTIPGEGKLIKVFRMLDELYGISMTEERVGVSTERTFRLLQYNAVTDQWIRDADVPMVVNGFVNFYVVDNGVRAWFVLQTAYPNKVSFYEVL